MAVVRGEDVIASPGPDQTLRAGDVLVMLLAVCGPILTRFAPTRTTAPLPATVAGPASGPHDRRPQ